MTRHEAMIYWLMKYNKAKAHKDEHWDAEERHEHEEYVEACEQAFEALDVVSNEKYVELRAGMKKFRTGNFVIYDIDYLLENLAREIYLLMGLKIDGNERPNQAMNHLKAEIAEWQKADIIESLRNMPIKPIKFEDKQPRANGRACIRCDYANFDDKKIYCCRWNSYNSPDDWCVKFIQRNEDNSNE